MQYILGDFISFSLAFCVSLKWSFRENTYILFTQELNNSTIRGNMRVNNYSWAKQVFTILVTSNCNGFFPNSKRISAKQKDNGLLGFYPQTSSSVFSTLRKVKEEIPRLFTNASIVFILTA